MQTLNHEEQSLLLKSLQPLGMGPEEVKAFFLDFQNDTFIASNY